MDNRLTLSGGLRLDGNSFSEDMSNPLSQFSPRGSVSFGLTDKVYLNSNIGRYYQLPSYTLLGYQDKNGELINKNNNVKYIQSDHLVGGLEFRRTSDSRISIEGFVKWYNQYPFSLTDSVSIASKGADFGVYGDEPATSASSGKAFGTELYYRDKLMDRANILLSYTWVRSEFDDKNGELVPSAWDNRHILSLSMAMKSGTNWTGGFKWRFVGGAPYTPYDYNRSTLIEAWDARGQGYIDYNIFNSQRLANFHQLDIRIDKEYFFKKWSLNLYLDIQNLYNFKAKEPDILVLKRNVNGTPLVNPNDPTRYVLKYLPSESGTVLPTFGIIVEF